MGEGRPGRAARLVHLAPLVTGLVLWLVGIHVRSLWGDEFHSLHRIRADGWRAFFEVVRGDNHPPLGFLLPRLSVAALGESELALRLPSLLAGLGTILIAQRLARRLPDAPSRRLAPWLVVLSSFCFMIFTEVRMYGLLALATLGLLQVVVDTLDPLDPLAPLAPGEGGPAPSRARWWAALWIAVGLHAHYYFLHTGVVLALLVAGAALASPELRPRARRLVLPALAGLALFLPWGLWGFATQLQSGRHSGGSSGLYLNAKGLAESFAHLLFMNASLGGRAVTLGVALPGTVAGAVVGALGLARLGTAPGRRVFALLVVGVALLVPLLAFAVAHFSLRASYNWRYIAGSGPPLLLVVAAGLGRWRPWPRALAGGVLLASMAVVTLVNAGSPGQEDYRGAVAYIVERLEPGDAVLTVPIWPDDPEGSPTGWDWYWPRLDVPARTPAPLVIPVREHERALEHPRVWVFRRYRYPPEVLAALRATFPHEEVTPIGAVMHVHLFER